MTKGRAVMLVAIGLILSVTLSPAPTHALDGNGWLKLSEAARTFYVAGVADAWFDVKAATDAHKEKDRGYTPTAIEETYAVLADCATGKPYRQVAAIVEKYMKDNPEKWHYTMASNIVVAVWTTCPR